ncbi:MAG: hypothetical protein K2H46_12430 [Muribaculaceae bacterium]|nr:hypothetical protein [Muribaculaceae bacterium]
MDSEQFYAYVEKWCEELAVLIEKLRSEEKEVYLIALSRKMPRFLHWVSCTESVKAVKLKSILKDHNIHLITELAIPLVCSNLTKEERNKIEGIVVDDAVIYGATVNRAGKDWLAFSGKRPYYSAIFQLVDTSVANIFVRESKKGILLSLENLLNALRFISKTIVSASLPVDIEYPIVNIEASYDQVKKFLEEKQQGKDDKSYVVTASIDGETSQSFTVLLPEESTRKYNNDFAKVRLFPSEKSQNTCKMEVIAANEVSVRNLKDTNYFKDQPYVDLWNSVRDRLSSELRDEEKLGEIYKEYYSVLDGRFDESRELLLMVWANYLLSLSTFCRNFDKLIPENVHVSILIDDLKLILGDSVANEASCEMESLLKNHLVSSSERIDSELPNVKIDNAIIFPYLKNIAESIQQDYDVEKSLDSIFKASHFTSNIFSLIQSSVNVCRHNAIGETFESLSFHLKTKFHKDPYMMNKIHKWIDSRIDECRIAPKYTKVIGGDGDRYYRRFFFTGTNPIVYCSVEEDC